MVSPHHNRWRDHGIPLPTPASYPAGVVAGPVGALWFTESGTSQIGRITNASMDGIVTGPDGRYL